MNLLKKPVVAIILSVFLISAVSSTAAHMKMEKLCNKVIYGFYDGVYYNGEMQESIESRLKTIIDEANEIKSIADNHEINTEHLYRSIDTLELGFAYSPDDIGYLYYCYDDLMTELKDIQKRLSTIELEDVESETLKNANLRINEEVELIKTAGYNETVREFYRKNNSDLFEWFAYRSNTTLPDPFSKR